MQAGPGQNQDTPLFHHTIVLHWEPPPCGQGLHEEAVPHAGDAVSVSQMRRTWKRLSPQSLNPTDRNQLIINPLLQSGAAGTAPWPRTGHAHSRCSPVGAVNSICLIEPLSVLLRGPLRSWRVQSCSLVVLAL